MPKVDCKHWKEYDSVSGQVSYCEVLAFNKQLSAREREECGCTPEKQRACQAVMDVSMGITAPAAPQTVPTKAFDTPKEIASNVLEAMKKKAELPLVGMLLLGILAGAYIAMGAQLSTIVTNDLAPRIGDGLTRLVSGMVFSLGLVLVVVGGAELFTGNNLMVVGVLDRKVTVGQLLRNWCIVYIANFIGAMILVAIYYGTDLWAANGSMVGAKAISTAITKTNLTWGEAFFRGIMCNWLVCLAVWLANAGRDAISKIVGIVLPITAFVASGFEHSIANMYFIPMGIMIADQPSVLSVLTGKTAELVHTLTWTNFLVRNLIPVTIGNIVGAGLFVGTFYWAVYLKPVTAPKAAGASQAAVRTLPR